MLSDRDLNVQLEKVIPYLIYAPKKFRDEIAPLVKDIYDVWYEGVPDTFQKYCEELDKKLENGKFTRKIERDISRFAEWHQGFHRRITELREDLVGFKEEVRKEIEELHRCCLPVCPNCKTNEHMHMTKTTYRCLIRRRGCGWQRGRKWKG